jgi:excisionase family DNA binding protein
MSCSMHILHGMHEEHIARLASSLLKADEVQAILGVDKSTVYRMAADGRLSAIKIGRQWRFPVEPLRTLLEEAGASSEPSSTPRPGWTSGLSTSVVEPVVDLAAHLLGVMMVATDMNGMPVTDVANPCPWFLDHDDDPEVLARCIEDWKGLAQDADFEPRLAVGSHGFECARVFVRDGDRLAGMILAGGIRPHGSDQQGLFELDDEERRRLIAALPRVTATVSRVIANLPLTLRSMR